LDTENNDYGVSRLCPSSRILKRTHFRN